MTTRGWLKKNQHRFRDKESLIQACTKECGVTRGTALKRWTEAFGNGASMAPSVCGDVISPADMLNRVDNVVKAEQFLLETVGDGYIEDEKFRNRIGVSKTAWERIRRLKKFSGMTLPIEQDGSRVIMWSSVNGIDALKASVSMSKYEVI